ncbi:ABC-ATPase domain-containing protein [Vibrio parahaemolyticus]|uniref:ABC-ATPase domain-containing protein n=1 Tax=Vibrio parahaemolyticus TaxID=670 RepID=UPI00038E51D3|nr:ABC-ATPase domain-containing protein [Vibrio parahaemolyticus]EJG0919553.1 ABC-ATPase domain-containing protein [Vibrio parahaemolyticus O1:K68]EJG0929555.1 ABC-ATPase domain-containing protein [Vibrio parahaemolyticus O1]EJG0943379.1 ABC-ATPase domain-containing protein [Vibrio parahaemolyticus O10]EQM51707.1 putative ATPase of the ABC class family protein [Vibrio parahaemolyticus VPCR-2010]EGQ9060656.1 isopentenyl-diphosphate delta-isomerase [Vibrio parahaemolyticus]
MDQLTATLKKIEKQNYRAYQQIKGQYDFTDFTLFIDHVQGDPYASASRFRATRAWSLTGLEWLKDESPVFQRAARDFIARSFEQFAKQENTVSIALNGQTVLDSTAVLFTEEGIELRFRVNLPAEGRSVLGKKANNILTFHLPKFIRRATLERELDKEAMVKHCQVVEDQSALREQLEAHNLVAFVANGSVLPRIAGNCDLPMKEAVEFTAPESLQVTLHAPNKGYVTGLGIPKGITLIVGGGFHGKSTLLNAIERSIYDHIPGDGREYIVTDQKAMKIRAEDGRCVHHLNLSNYINHLPMGKDTADFSTQDASGSTSQAAWLQESIEAGATSLLIDEDTSATNFMIRDERMQALVAKGDEPITPLVDRIGQLRDELDISTIIVMGGSGDYLDVANTVIQMHDYQAVDVTEKAKQVIAQHPTQRHNESEESLQTFRPRALNRVALMNILTDGKFRVSAKGKDSLRFGKEFTDLSALEQIESADEVNAIGWLWFQLAQLPGWCNNPAKDIEEMLSGEWHASLPKQGDLAKPRTLDVMAALNRMRKSQFKPSH